MARHHHVDHSGSNNRVFLPIAVNMNLSIVQISDGILSGSLALIADALHNFSDAISHMIALAARKIAHRPREFRPEKSSERTWRQSRCGQT